MSNVGVTPSNKVYDDDEKNNRILQGFINQLVIAVRCRTCI